MEDYLENLLMRCITDCNLETGDFPGPVVTISRQAGCSAQRIAIKLSKILTGYSYMSDRKKDAEWKWVDRGIFEGAVEEMIKDVKSGEIKYSESTIKTLRDVAKAFSSEAIYDIADEEEINIFKGIICLLACRGRTIIVGRSAGAILKEIPNKLNIRLEAPLGWRINRIMQMQNMKQAAAEKYVREIDEKRDLFIRKITGEPANNEDFDVIFNYSSLEDDEIIDAIVNILKNKKIISHFE